jgi:hypothetical protein
MLSDVVDQGSLARSSITHAAQVYGLGHRQTLQHFNFDLCLKIGTRPQHRFKAPPEEALVHCIPAGRAMLRSVGFTPGAVSVDGNHRLQQRYDHYTHTASPVLSDT